MTPAVDPAVLDAWARGIAPPTRLTVSEWADRERMLAGVGASEPGPWRTDRTPYLREIMDRLSPSDPCRIVVVKAGAQVGKTETGLNWLGYAIAHAPAPTMFVQPTENTAKAVVIQRLDPMIDATPAVRALVTRSRAKEEGSSQLMKRYPGGVLKMAWFNSPATLRSMPAANVFFDEVDAEADEAAEGDFIELGLARSRTFPRRKALITSTPGLMRTSRIEKQFRRGDQRIYKLPCPHCEFFQALTQAGLVWEKEGEGTPVPGSAHFVCEGCARRIEESAKAVMLPSGVWVPTARGEPRVHSYWLPSHYSPLGWLSWDDIAAKFHKAYRALKEGHDPTEMKAFVNTIEGRGYDDTEETAQSDWSGVQARADAYDHGTVPSGGFFLTAGIDVQDDRLEASVYAWGPGEECWLVEHDVLVGDPGREELWTELDEAVLNRRWPTEDGRELAIVSAAIDTGGHFTQEVYGFARTRPTVMAIKGSNQSSAPIVDRPSTQDVSWRGARIKDGVQLWMVGVHAIKKLLTQRLKVAISGPKRLHTPAGLSEDFYQQLCGEKLVARHVRGVGREEWVKVRPSQRVEAWDCWVYAYAAAYRAGLQRMDWDRARAQRERAAAPKHRPAPAAPAEGVSVRRVSQATAPRPRVARSKWLER